jgi:hypothetical protein
MKKTTKPHKAKKRKKGAAQSLKGVAKLAKAKKGMEDVAKPFGIMLGLAAASLAGNGIDKIKFLAPDATNPKFQVKSLAKPALLLLAGAATVYGTHGKKTPSMEFVNGLGWGFVTGGTFNVAQVVLKKNPFAGLGASEETDSKYYKDQLNEMAKVLELNKFKVDLPALTEGKSESVTGVPSLEREIEMRNTNLIL